MNKQSKLAVAVARALAYLTPTPKVADIVASIEQKIGQLDVAERRLIDDAAEAEAEAAACVRRAVDARREANRARRVATNLQALVK